MSIFNDKQKEAMVNGIYICSECGRIMEFEDKYEDILACPYCGDSVDLDDYGWDDDEYEELYLSGEDDSSDELEELYDEVCGELSD